MSDAIEQVLSAAEVDDRFQPNISRVSICMDSELVVELDRLEEQFEEAKTADEQLNRPPLAPDIARRIIELRESDRAKAANVEFRFKGIGRGPYRRLREQHPPTETQVADAEERDARRPDWDPETFYPALCAAAAVNPAVPDPAWWAEKFERWEDGRVVLIQGAARVAQEGYMELPKAEAAYEAIGLSRTKRK